MADIGLRSKNMLRAGDRRSEIQTYPPVNTRPARGPLKTSVSATTLEGFASLTHITEMSGLGSQVFGFGILVADSATAD